jgi:nicotinamide-nucleotide amidase
MKFALLLTGNELMSGDTVDSNSAYVSQALKQIGVMPFIKQVVGDDLPLLVDSIVTLSQSADIVFVNGGLGPTVDDLTAQALAKAAGVGIEINQDALQHLKEWAAQRDFELSPSNLKQCELPQGCEVIDNPNGSAVGFSLRINQCLVLCTPGVPSEMKPMVDNYIVDLTLKEMGISAKRNISRIRTFGFTESGLQDMFDLEFPDWPDNVELGFRVQMPVLEIKVATLGEELDTLNQQWTQKVLDFLGPYVIGRDQLSLPQSLFDCLNQQDLKVTFAESCTGGLIASQFTQVAGSSVVFEGAYVSYSNRLKQAMLAVSEDTLVQHGAVSENVVCEMLQGALDATGADVGIAVSGVAGPSGGSAEKPVGTVWIAFGGNRGITTRKFYLPMRRDRFQSIVAAISMDLLRRYVLGLPTEDVQYFSELKRKK